MAPRESVKATAQRLSATFDRELQRLLEPGTEVALLNFPKWGNLGDAAIWLGEEAALARAGARVRYRCDSRTYRRRLLRSAVGERGTILLNGGGNLGDVYPVQQRVRKRVLRDFPQARVVQLPQTIWFRDQDRAARFGELCRAHPGLVLMVRERRSLETARETLGFEAVLAPDAAFALGPLEPQASASRDVLWLMRSDRERLAPAFRPAAGSEVADWPDKSGRGAGALRLRSALAVNRALSAPLERGSRMSPLVAALVPRTFAPIARRRLALAMATLEPARAVVTDRLHGHILATLLGLPHVVLDSASGKSRATYETWTSECPGIRYAADAAEAEAAVRELLRDSPAKSRAA